MQQQKLNVVNTISLKGVSSRYMTSKVYHQEKRKCYIFVGTSQMIYYLAIKKDEEEQYEEQQQEQQVYKLQELKKIDQTETVLTCLCTMIYKDSVVVLSGFVNKYSLSSQIAAYLLNSNLIYFNSNIFNETKINIVNMKQSSYANIQLLFTSSSDNAIRIYRFIEPQQKKYQFELQFLHIFKFEEFIIDFDMKCIFYNESCIYSHELSNNKVCIDNQDCGQYEQEFIQNSQKKNNKLFRLNSLPKKESEREESNIYESKTTHEFNLTHQTSQEYLQINGSEIKSSQGLDNQKYSSNNLQQSSLHDYASTHNLEQQIQNEELINLPNLEKMKKAQTQEQTAGGINIPRSVSSNVQKNLTVKLPQEQSNNLYNSQEIRTKDDENSENNQENNIKKQQETPNFTRKGSSYRAQTFVGSDHNLKHHQEISSSQIYNSKSPLKQSQQELKGNPPHSNFLKVNDFNQQENNTDLSQKQDEIYICFTDIDGLIIVKKFLVNPNRIDLEKSFQTAIDSFEADLGITGSYAKFIKCTDNQLDNYAESSQSAQFMSKKQQKKQVKFQQNQKKQLLQSGQSSISFQSNSDIQQQFDNDEDRLKDQSQSYNINQDDGFNERQDKIGIVREVTLNLIVTNLMGDVIEFKNIPIQGLDNPVAFPSVDNYNSGVTGLCIKSQDTLEILVSYFDGSVIFFDLNNEDEWNLKLSQPLNSNHFGVYYENTHESDILFLVSDDTIQIYELNSYHIN